jgi:hypothetical protein
VKDLEVAASEYWTRGGSSSQEMKALQVKIRGLMFVISGFEEQADVLFRNHTSAYQEKVDALFSAATGGLFETKGRKADFARAIDVKGKSAELVAVARRARRESAGMTAVFWFVRRFPKTLSHVLSVIASALLFPFRWIRQRRMKPLILDETEGV